MRISDWSSDVCSSDLIAHGGAFVVLHHDGTVRIERGFVRLEDEALADPRPEPEADADATDTRAGEDEQAEDGDEEVQEIEEEELGKPISDSLNRDLSDYRTLAIRVALGARAEIDMTALQHTRNAHTF